MITHLEQLAICNNLIFVNCINKWLHNCLLLDAAHVKSIYIVPNCLQSVSAIQLNETQCKKEHNCMPFFFNNTTRYFKFLSTRPQQQLTPIHQSTRGKEHKSSSAFSIVNIPLENMYIMYLYICIQQDVSNKPLGVSSLEGFQQFAGGLRLNFLSHHVQKKEKRCQQLTLNFIFFVVRIFDCCKIERRFIWQHYSIIHLGQKKGEKISKLSHLLYPHQVIEVYSLSLSL